MAQNDFSIANQGFPSFRSDLNDALQSLASNSSGTTEPPTTYAYQWWYDETNDILKIRNSANDAWIDFATFDQAAGSWSLASLDVTGDAEISGDLTVDTDTLYVDSANDRVGIGTSSPNDLLHVLDTSGSATVNIQASDTGTSRINFGDTTDIDVASIRYAHSLNDLIFTINASEAMRIDSSGRVGIGTSSPSVDLHVVGGSSTSLRVQNTISTGSTRAEVVNDANEGAQINTYNSGYTAGSVFGVGAGGSVFAADNDLALSGGGTIRMGIGTSEAMRIDSSGRVGIGTSSPSATLDVNGSLSKNSGSFKIDHPVKPDTHHLVHSFVEGPQADNLYRGKVTLVDGFATVNLDEAGRMTEGTFVALNGNVQCWTTNEDGWTQVRGKVEGNTLTIEAQDPACTDEVSWLVIGERHDQHMMDTEWTDENGRVITEPAKENTQ